MRTFSGVVCLLALLVAACDEDNIQPVREELVGSWSLVQRICSTANVVETPTSLGHSIILQLDANGQARVRQNASTVTTTTYGLRGSGIQHEIDFGAPTFFGTEDVNLVISNDDSLTLQWRTSGGGCLAVLTRVAS